MLKKLKVEKCCTQDIKSEHKIVLKYSGTRFLKYQRHYIRPTNPIKQINPEEVYNKIETPFKIH